MTATLAPDIAEVADLEALFDALAPCDWGRGHEHTETDCAGVAVVLARAACAPAHPYRVCSVGADWFAAVIAAGLPCNACKRPTAECWRVVPI